MAEPVKENPEPIRLILRPEKMGPTPPSVAALATAAVQRLSDEAGWRRYLVSFVDGTIRACMRDGKLEDDLTDIRDTLEEQWRRQTERIDHGPNCSP